MKIFLLLLASYLIGSIPFSYLAGVYIGGTDIRKVGSGNVGATNVLRTLGWPVALLALCGDFGKGMLAVGLGSIFGDPLVASLCGLAAVIGHSYTVFLRFKGGKSVATSGGALLLLAPKGFLIALIIFLAPIIITRYVSLGSILAAITAPFVLILLGYEPYLVAVVTVMALLIVYRHRDNIKRISMGTESKIGEKPGKKP